MSMLLNSFLNAVAGASVTYLTGETTGSVTDAAGAFTDLVDLGTLSLLGGERYLGFFSTDVNVNNSSGLSETRITDNGASIFATDYRAGIQATSDYLSHGGIFLFQPGSTGNHAVKFQGRRLSAGTATFRNSRLSLIKLDSSDIYAEALALQSWTSPTSATAQTACTLSFTPATAGDYLIIASFLPYMPGLPPSAYLTDGTSSTPTRLLENGTGTDAINPTVLCWYRAGISGAQNISLKIIDEYGSATTGTAEVRMIAIRLDKFRSVRQTSLASDNIGAEASYTTGLSQTFTPSAGDHLTLAAWTEQTNATGTSAAVQLLDGATSVNEIIVDEGAGSSDGNTPGFSHRIAAYTAASRTQALQRKIIGSGSSYIHGGAVIACLDLTGYGAAPVFTLAPTVSTDTGFFAEGDTATVSFAHTGVTQTYQWKRDGIAISGATSASYTYVSGDVGHTVTCTVTATNPAWGSTPATSAGNAIGTPTYSANPRVTSSGDTRVTSSGDTRAIFIRTA